MDYWINEHRIISFLFAERILHTVQKNFITKLFIMQMMCWSVEVTFTEQIHALSMSFITITLVPITLVPMNDLKAVLCGLTTGLATTNGDFYLLNF